MRAIAGRNVRNFKNCKGKCHGSRVNAWTVCIFSVQGNSHDLFQMKRHSVPRFLYSISSSRHRASNKRLRPIRIRAVKMKKIVLFVFIIAFVNTTVFAQNAESYRADAQRGDAYAQWKLGRCYQNGEGGVSKNSEQAVYWYTKAANQGDRRGQFSLGYCYDIGFGVKRDLEQAVYWYTKAANQGSSGAQRNLAECYYSGDGVTKNYELAFKWYKKAADQGDPVALHGVARSYYFGYGVEKDLVKAKKYAEMARSKYIEKGENTQIVDLLLMLINSQHND